MDFVLAAGTAGMILLLAGFVMKKTRKTNREYVIINIVGGGLLTYYAYMMKTVPFIILEGFWFLFAWYKLYQAYFKKTPSMETMKHSRRKHKK